MTAAARGGDARPLTKVLVELPNHWAEYGSETLWSTSLGDDLYEILNVPFFAYGLNYGDVVRATPAIVPGGARLPAGLERGAAPVVREVVRRGGHATVRVVFRRRSGDRAARRALLLALRGLDVSFEGMDDTFFALDVAPGGDLEGLLDRLDSLEKRDVLGYETCEARLPGEFDAPSLP